MRTVGAGGAAGGAGFGRKGDQTASEHAARHGEGEADRRRPPLPTPSRAGGEGRHGGRHRSRDGGQRGPREFDRHRGRGAVCEECRQEGGRTGHAAPLQPLPQQLLGAGEAAVDGPLRPTEEPGGFLAGLALQTAEHDRVAVAVAEAGQFLVEDRAEVVPAGRGRRVGLAHVSRLSFAHQAADLLRSRLPRHPDGRAVEPPGHRPDAGQVGGAAGEHDEHGLEGVVGVGRVAERPPARAPHHRPVPGEQHRERRLAPGGRERAEQLAVRNVRGEAVAQVSGHGRRIGAHGGSSPAFRQDVPADRARRTTFFGNSRGRGKCLTAGAGSRDFGRSGARISSDPFPQLLWGRIESRRRVRVAQPVRPDRPPPAAPRTPTSRPPCAVS
jgi:hypothetical protein